MCTFLVYLSLTLLLLFLLLPKWRNLGKKTESNPLFRRTNLANKADSQFSAGVCVRVNQSIFLWFAMWLCDEMATSPCWTDPSRSHDPDCRGEVDGGNFHILNKLISRLQPF